MEFWQAMIFGLVQGLTEFLPVSSSAHLDIYRFISGVQFAQDEDVAFFAVLHLGSLAAILLVFRDDVVRLLRALPGMVKKVCTGRMRTFRLYEKLNFLLAVSTVPAALFGLLFEDRINAVFGNLTMVGIFLILTGVVLWATRFMAAGNRGIREMNLPSALAVGLAQVLAIFPGVSRSGMTISSGLLLGFDREIAARYSFLLGLPVIAGAGLLKLGRLQAAPASSWGYICIGVVFAFVGSYAALRILLAWVRAGKLYWFAPYVWTVGIVLIVMQEV